MITKVSTVWIPFALEVNLTSRDVVYEENHRVVLSAVTLTRKGYRRSQPRGGRID